MTAMTTTFPGDLEALLLQLTFPDTNTVRLATAHLKKILAKVSCVSSLLCVMGFSTNAAARQLSAVYLRKKIGQHWTKLRQEEKEQVQTILLEKMVQEQERPVKNAIAGVVTVVAKHALPNGAWPHLLPLLSQLCTHTSPCLREVALRVLRVIVKTMSKVMHPHLPLLRDIFQRALDDTAVLVRVEALKALVVMAAHRDDQATMQWFDSILGVMLNALSSCVMSEGASDVAVQALEVLEELADDPNDVLNSKLGPIVASVMSIALNPNVEMDVRERSAVVISSVIAHRAPALMESPALVESLVDGTMQILIESCSNDDDRAEEDDDDDDEFSNSCRGLAVQILDNLVLSLPDAIIYPLVRSRVSPMMGSGAPSRRAALFALMVSVEGAANAMKGDFGDILNLVLQGLNDQDSVVSEAACLAIGQLSDHMTESMSQHHAHVMQALLACIQQPSVKIMVKRKLCLAIEAMCSELDSGAIVPYLPVLMQRLTELMQQHGGDLALLEAAINAVAATAKNTQAAFQPFSQQIITYLHSAMQSGEDAHASLKASAMTCAGTVLLGTGETTPCPPLMQLSLDAFQGASDPSLREGVFHFWAHVSELLKGEFTPYLDTIVHLCIDVIDSEDGMNFRSSKADLNAEFGGSATSSEDEEDESIGSNTVNDSDDDELDGSMRCSILSGFLDEKVAAIDCLTSICRFSGPGALPFFDSILECFELLVEYPHENVRLVAMKGLHDLAESARTLWPSSQPDTASTKAQECMDRILPIITTLSTDDESRDVLASSLDAVLSLVLKYRQESLSVFQEHMADLVRMLKAVLDGECEADKYPIADIEKDNVLDSCCDLIGGVAMALKGSMVSVLDQLLPSIINRINSSDQLTQALLLGALGECAEAMEAAMAPALPHVLPLALNALSADHPRLRRNGAFCAGALFMTAPVEDALATQSMNHLIQLCCHSATISSTDDHVLAAIDNLCSALCKLILGPTRPRLTIDPDAVTKTILMLCPLKSDMDECRFVYETLATLWTQLRAPGDLATPMVCSLARALSSPTLSPEIKALIAPMLQSIGREYISTLDLTSITPDQAEICRQAFHQ